MTVPRLLLLVRGSIAVKLTLTLVGFVALTTAVAGLYLSRSLESFGVEAVAQLPLPMG